MIQDKSVTLLSNKQPVDDSANAEKGGDQSDQLNSKLGRQGVSVSDLGPVVISGTKYDEKKVIERQTSQQQGCKSKANFGNVASTSIKHQQKTGSNKHRMLVKNNFSQNSIVTLHLRDNIAVKPADDQQQSHQRGTLSKTKSSRKLLNADLENGKNSLYNGEVAKQNEKFAQEQASVEGKNLNSQIDPRDQMLLHEQPDQENNVSDQQSKVTGLDASKMTKLKPKFPENSEETQKSQQKKYFFQEVDFAAHARLMTKEGTRGGNSFGDEKQKHLIGSPKSDIKAIKLDLNRQQLIESNEASPSMHSEGSNMQPTLDENKSLEQLSPEIVKGNKRPDLYTGSTNRQYLEWVKNQKKNQGQKAAPSPETLKVDLSLSYVPQNRLLPSHSFKNPVNIQRFLKAHGPQKLNLKYKQIFSQAVNNSRAVLDKDWDQMTPFERQKVQKQFLRLIRQDSQQKIGIQSPTVLKLNDCLNPQAAYLKPRHKQRNHSTNLIKLDIAQNTDILAVIKENFGSEGENYPQSFISQIQKLENLTSKVHHDSYINEEDMQAQPKKFAIKAKPIIKNTQKVDQKQRFVSRQNVQQKDPVQVARNPTYPINRFDTIREDQEQKLNHMTDTSLSLDKNSYSSTESKGNEKNNTQSLLMSILNQTQHDLFESRGRLQPRIDSPNQSIQVNSESSPKNKTRQTADRQTYSGHFGAATPVQVDQFGQLAPLNKDFTETGFREKSQGTLFGLRETGVINHTMSSSFAQHTQIQPMLIKRENQDEQLSKEMSEMEQFRQKMTLYAEQKGLQDIQKQFQHLACMRDEPSPFIVFDKNVEPLRHTQQKVTLQERVQKLQTRLDGLSTGEDLIKAISLTKQQTLLNQTSSKIQNQLSVDIQTTGEQYPQEPGSVLIPPTPLYKSGGNYSINNTPKHVFSPAKRQQKNEQVQLQGNTMNQDLHDIASKQYLNAQITDAISSPSFEQFTEEPVYAVNEEAKSSYRQQREVGVDQEDGGTFEDQIHPLEMILRSESLKSKVKFVSSPYRKVSLSPIKSPQKRDISNDNVHEIHDAQKSLILQTQNSQKSEIQKFQPKVTKLELKIDQTQKRSFSKQNKKGKKHEKSVIMRPHESYRKKGETQVKNGDKTVPPISKGKTWLSTVWRQYQGDQGDLRTLVQGTTKQLNQTKFQAYQGQNVPRVHYSPKLLNESAENLLSQSKTLMEVVSKPKITFEGKDETYMIIGAEIDTKTTESKKSLQVPQTPEDEVNKKLNIQLLDCSTNHLIQPLDQELDQNPQKILIQTIDKNGRAQIPLGQNQTHFVSQKHLYNSSDKKSSQASHNQVNQTVLLTSQRQQQMFSTTQTNSPSSNNGGKKFAPLKASGTQVTAETPSKESSRGGSISEERRPSENNWKIRQNVEIKKVEKYVKMTESEEILEHEKVSPSFQIGNKKMSQAMYESQLSETTRYKRFGVNKNQFTTKSSHELIPYTRKTLEKGKKKKSNLNADIPQILDDADYKPYKPSPQNLDSIVSEEASLDAVTFTDQQEDNTQNQVLQKIDSKPAVLIQNHDRFERKMLNQASGTGSPMMKLNSEQIETKVLIQEEDESPTPTSPVTPHMPAKVQETKPKKIQGPPHIIEDIKNAIKQNEEALVSIRDKSPQNSQVLKDLRGWPSGKPEVKDNKDLFKGFLSKQVLPQVTQKPRNCKPLTKLLNTGQIEELEMYMGKKYRHKRYGQRKGGSFSTTDYSRNIQNSFISPRNSDFLSQSVRQKGMGLKKTSTNELNVDQSIQSALKTMRDQQKLKFPSLQSPINTFGGKQQNKELLVPQTTRAKQGGDFNKSKIHFTLDSLQITEQKTSDDPSKTSKLPFNQKNNSVSYRNAKKFGMTAGTRYDDSVNSLESSRNQFGKNVALNSTTLTQDLQKISHFGKQKRSQQPFIFNDVNNLELSFKKNTSLVRPLFGNKASIF